MSSLRIFGSICSRNKRRRHNVIIRKAKSTDADDLKVLYFEYLTKFPPKEEQDMTQWEKLLRA